jgi:hypothetical protein
MSPDAPFLYLDIDEVPLRRRHGSVGFFDAFEIAPDLLFGRHPTS